MALVTSALAFTNGEPDGNAHPFVGSLVVKFPDGGLIQWCSGTLISERVFLTASHCTAPLDRFLAANPGSQALVTFDPTISVAGTSYSGVWHTGFVQKEGFGKWVHPLM